MYISRFQLENYKSFREPGPVEFTSGFNIIAGQNNAGKTALLEALGLVFKWNPHRSLKTIPARDTAPGQMTWADVSFTISPNELKELMLSSPGAVYFLPKPDLQSPFAQRIGFRDDSNQSLERLLDAVFSVDSLSFKVRFQAGPGQAPPALAAIAHPSFELYPTQGPANALHSVAFQAHAGGRLKVVQSQQAGTDIGIQLANAFRNHVYRFTAERMNVGKGSHGVNTVLAPNASNLPEVLNQLQHNVFRFRNLNRQLTAILPQVKQASVRGIGPSEVEIVVWCHDPESAREDLAVPLSESGTGIGQVLAILYVVMTSERPQSIIIDEPQSFLHPGAARKLIEFLKLYPQHQYIIATHSATIISAANPRTITVARFEDSETKLEQLDAKAEKNIQAVLGELGIRLSDSFGADNILWVEGRTEEKCFPLVIEKIMSQPLMGTEILSKGKPGTLGAGTPERFLKFTVV